MGKRYRLQDSGCGLQVEKPATHNQLEGLVSLATQIQNVLSTFYFPTVNRAANRSG